MPLLQVLRPPSEASVKQLPPVTSHPPAALQQVSGPPIYLIFLVSCLDCAVILLDPIDMPGSDHGHDSDQKLGLWSGYGLDPSRDNGLDHLVVATSRLVRVLAAHQEPVALRAGAHARLAVGRQSLSFGPVPRLLFDVQFPVSSVAPRPECVFVRLQSPFVCASPRGRLPRAHPVFL